MLEGGGPQIPLRNALKHVRKPIAAPEETDGSKAKKKVEKLVRKRLKKEGGQVDDRVADEPGNDEAAAEPAPDLTPTP